MASQCATIIPVTPRTGPPILRTLPTPVIPEYAIGQRVIKYDQTERPLTIDGLHNRSGNRPYYHFAEVRGWYPEHSLQRVGE